MKGRDREFLMAVTRSALKEALVCTTAVKGAKPREWDDRQLLNLVRVKTKWLIFRHICIYLSSPVQIQRFQCQKMFEHREATEKIYSFDRKTRNLINSQSNYAKLTHAGWIRMTSNTYTWLHRIALS